ncbi:MAG: DNA double-strand break repair nuclease NurA [Chthonomonadales bacterium]
MIDLEQLLPQIADLVQYRLAELAACRGGKDAALEVIAGLAEGWETLAERIEAADAGGLIAIPQEAPPARHPLPAVPRVYCVVATDGSQIGYDRHEVAPCALINVGRVRIEYDDPPAVRLDGCPTLLYRTEELMEADGGDAHVLSARRISTLRMEQECQELGKLIQEARSSRPTIALVDGTLIPWSLEAETDEVRKRALEGFERLLNIAHSAQVPIAGYISDPGSRDVMNLLHALRCGIEKAPCGLKCFSRRALRKGAPCEPLQDLTDAVLFAAVLQPGERSAVFRSRSRILQDLAEENRTCFCYLRLEGEVARIEIPAWVAEQSEWFDRVHAVVWDQVQKGLGYPRALTEAHELAVVRGEDRRLFFELLSAQLAAKGLPLTRTGKAMAKAVRSV